MFLSVFMFLPFTNLMLYNKNICICNIIVNVCIFRSYLKWENDWRCLIWPPELKKLKKTLNFWIQFLPLWLWFLQVKDKRAHMNPIIHTHLFQSTTSCLLTGLRDFHCKGKSCWTLMVLFRLKSLSHCCVLPPKYHITVCGQTCP